ncbi:MAG: hypothetical protein KatS3mg087_0637 [Patescibacteria group bacterium]|nr:MAG: hypothetical protein KatS3mg087_0637 [Patescibacteria group bacterium]
MASVESGDRALKVNEIAIIAELLGCKVDLLYPATSWRSSIYSLLEYDKKVGVACSIEKGVTESISNQSRRVSRS